MVLLFKQVFDMLRDPQQSRPLAIHKDAGAGTYCQGLSEYAVHKRRVLCLQLQNFNFNFSVNCNAVMKLPCCCITLPTGF